MARENLNSGEPPRSAMARRRERESPPFDLARMTKIRWVHTLLLHKIRIVDLRLDDPR
jgi:hypothetical protein